ncbi:MAG TPA: hypothetical protein VGT61_14245 [Thermomicrobiales bacterium]|jgi:hypothetical protein|nr:hypothetical protein [Thermomicrobiales bacterium]
MTDHDDHDRLARWLDDPAADPEDLDPAIAAAARRRHVLSDATTDAHYAATRPGRR